MKPEIHDYYKKYLEKGKYPEGKPLSIVKFVNTFHPSLIEIKSKYTREIPPTKKINYTNFSSFHKNIDSSYKNDNYNNYDEYNPLFNDLYGFL